MKTILRKLAFVGLLLISTISAKAQLIVEMPFSHSYNSLSNNGYEGTFDLPAFTSPERITNIKVDFVVILGADEDLRNSRNTRQQTDIHYYGYLGYQFPGINITARPPFPTDDRWFDFTGTASVPANGVTNVNLRDSNGNLEHMFPEYIWQPQLPVFDHYRTAPKFTYSFHNSTTDLTNPNAFFERTNIHGSISGKIIYTYAAPAPGSLMVMLIGSIPATALLVYCRRSKVC